MDGADLRNPYIADALYGSQPQRQVRVYWIFHKNRRFCTAKGFGDLLHGEGVGGRTGADPQNVDIVFYRFIDMLRRSHFDGKPHPGFFFYILDPPQGFFSYPFKIIGPRAWFPDTGPDGIDPDGFDALGGLQQLFFRFRAAGPRDDRRLLQSDTPGIKWFNFHYYLIS